MITQMDYAGSQRSAVSARSTAGAVRRRSREGNRCALEHLEVEHDAVSTASVTEVGALSLVEALSQVPDPRKPREVRYGVLAVLLLAAGAVLTSEYDVREPTSGSSSAVPQAIASMLSIGPG